MAFYAGALVRHPDMENPTIVFLTDRNDLCIAFGVDPEAYRRSNAYIVSEQGKPPDFVLEIASRGTGGQDTTYKRRDYAELGIPEYWRFDETGGFHRSNLAGDQLLDGRYQSIDIDEVEDGVLQGYSTALGLRVRWQHGELHWHDPSTGLGIPTLEQEREARMAAEARVRELEAELELRNEQP